MDQIPARNALEQTALERAIKLVGGPAKLARFITERDGRITAQAICDWRKCPPGRVLSVEAATVDPETGRPRVTRHELRPDLYPVEPPKAVEKAAA